VNIKKAILLIAAVGVAGVAGIPTAQANGTTYRAPYQAGPSGGTAGDGGLERTHSSVDPATGTVSVFQASVVPGPVGCAATGPMAYLQVQHPINGDEDKVLIAYDDATLSQYSWLKVNVYAPVDGETIAIGSFAQRGQKVAEDGNIVVALDDVALEPGSTMTINFGIEVGSACPNVDGGTVKFPTVAVN